MSIYVDLFTNCCAQRRRRRSRTGCTSPPSSTLAASIGVAATHGELARRDPPEISARRFSRQSPGSRTISAQRFDPPARGEYLEQLLVGDRPNRKGFPP